MNQHPEAIQRAFDQPRGTVHRVGHDDLDTHIIVTGLIDDTPNGAVGFTGRVGDGEEQEFRYITYGTSWAYEPPERTIDELREPLASQLAIRIAQLEDAARTLDGKLNDLSVLPSHTKGLREDVFNVVDKVGRLTQQFDRFQNEGTGLGAEIIRIIQHAADRGYVDVCISSPEPKVDASGMRIGDAGWTITLGKREP